MKKLFTCLSIAFLIGMSVNVMAQSTGSNPYPGATHNYQVTPNGSNSYTWSVLNTDLTAAQASTATLTQTGNKVTIDWSGSLTPGAQYFVKVEEKEDGSECRNAKLFLVTITASTFKLDIAANATKYCYLSPVAITATSPSFEPSYDHGKAEVVYTITPDDYQGKWRFTYADNATSEFSYSLKTVGNGTASGNVITVTDEANPVILTFEITNVNPETNTTDAAGDKAYFESQISISACQTGPTWNLVDTSNGDHDASTVIDRPHTTAIEALD